MKVNKNKISGNSKEKKKKRRIATSNSPVLKNSFTDFPNEIKNLRINTLSKNRTSNQIQQITKNNIVNILCLSNSSNFKRRNISNNNQNKINSDNISQEQITYNLIRIKNNEKRNNISKNKNSKNKPQKVKITVSNDFSFSNHNTPSNIIKEEKKNNKEKILNNNFNYINLRTNTYSNVNNINKYNTFSIINKENKKNKNENNNNQKIKNDNIQEKINKLNENLKIKLQENKHNKNKKYNIIQKIFEELILILPEENRNILKTILIGIHEVIIEYFSELKNLKEEYEENKKQLIKLENDNIYNMKLIKQKDLEIEKLKKKISCSMTTQEQQIISKSTNSSFVISLSTEKEKSNDRKNRFYFKSQNKIEELNKKNIFDLNALYFNDKIRMKSDFYSIPKSNNGYLIPPLNLDFEKIKDDKNDIKEVSDNNIQKNKNKLSFIQKVALSFDLN